MTVIGITGPTGSGKTTALEALKAMGAEVVDCDALYYELLRSDEPLRKALTDAFGEVFLPSGELDRQRLGTLVFGNQKELNRLNSIVFPAVSGAVEKILNRSQAPIGVIDAIIQPGVGLCIGFSLTGAAGRGGIERFPLSVLLDNDAPSVTIVHPYSTVGSFHVNSFPACVSTPKVL